MNRQDLSRKFVSLRSALAARGRRAYWLAAVIGATLLLVAGAVLLRHHDRQRRAAASERAIRLASAEVAVSLGAVRLGDPQLLEVVLDNPGPQSLEITALVPSCDCLKVLEAPSRLEAGQKVSITLVFEGEKVGAVNVTLNARFAGGATPPRSYRFTGLVTAANAGRRPGHLVSAASLLGKEIGEAPLFIDVRAAVKFQRAHIPGALNLPLFAVKTRAHLRSRRVVLVAEGYDETVLVPECARLREAGWDRAAVLEGGVPAWCAAGGKLEGDRPADPGLEAISARDFSQARQTGDPWVIVAPAEARSDARLAASFAGHTLAFTDGGREDATRVQRAVEAAAPAAAAGALPRVLVVRAQSDRKTLPGLPAGVPAFVLTGGVDALRTQELAFNAASPGSRSLAMTGNPSGQASSVGGSSAGCGTCPKK